MLDYGHDYHAARIKYKINGTIILMASFIIVYFTTLLISDERSWTCTLYMLGSKYTPAIRYEYQLYRLINPIFLHSNVHHIVSNLISQYFLCYPFELKHGSVEFLSFYFIAGVAGNTLSALYFTHGTSVGASGAIFGFIGYGAMSCLYKRPSQQKLMFLTFTFAFGVLQLLDSNSHIDFMGHLGGFLIGCIWRSTNNFKELRVLAPALVAIGIMAIFIIPVKHKLICQ